MLKPRSAGWEASELASSRSSVLINHRNFNRGRNVSRRGRIYKSEHGDSWLLCRENDRVFVRHRANQSSGGKVTSIEISDFLGPGNAGSEHQAIARWIGRLVDAEC